MSAVISTGVIAAAAKSFFEVYQSECSDEAIRGKKETITDIVEVHAMGAAAAGLGTGMLPGAGSIAAFLALTGIIYAMYYKINVALDIRMKGNILKTLASAVLTNISLNFAGSIVASTIFSFVPGAGTVAASLITAGLAYGTAIASGVIYIKLLTNLLKAGQGNDLDSLTEVELKLAAKNAAKGMNIKSVVKDAKNAYVIAQK